MSKTLEKLSQFGYGLSGVTRGRINSEIMVNHYDSLFTLYPGVSFESEIQTPESIGLNPVEVNTLKHVSELIADWGHGRLDRDVKLGKITYAMIRPLGNIVDDDIESDQSLAKYIMEQVRTEFNPLLTVNLPFDREAVSRFYGPLEGKLSQLEIVYAGRHMPVWEHLVQLMASGATTAMILEAKKVDRHTGHAWEQWRRMIGHTFPSKADAGTIREVYGIDNVNNVVHGSDSNQAVAREIRWLGEYIAAFIHRSPNGLVDPSEARNSLPIQHRHKKTSH